MATACITQVTFQDEGFAKPMVARFDQAHASTDGGAILLKSVDTHLGLTKRLTECLVDERQPGKIQHHAIELLRQRVFGLVCGYADCNDAARLADDPIHKLLLERDPLYGLALASQPTLSRFENSVSWTELRDMAHVLADTVIEQQRRRRKGRATRITIDVDPTDDPTHGEQQLTFFNGHYDTWCYLPIVATVTFDDEREQWAVAAVLRPGNAPATRGARGILRRLLSKLRQAFPAAVFRVRLDGGFANPKLFKFLEHEQLEYVVAMPSNPRLEKRARRLMGKARMRSKLTGRTEHLYGETRYAAKSWHRKRRVIIKAEVVRHPGRDPKNNPRFVVTNLPDPPQAVYELYCGRGDVENRLKELHHGLRWTARVARAFWPTSFGCSSPWPPTSCSRTCADGRRRRFAPTPRSPPCASGSSKSRCGSSARRDGLSCICPWRSRGSRPGYSSRARSARHRSSRRRFALPAGFEGEVSSFRGDHVTNAASSRFRACVATDSRHSDNVFTIQNVHAERFRRTMLMSRPVHE
ncbi:MAG: IS1380 family transposase [Candidatus Rokuibacteriota bacterium]|nr:MAG: IS1380 family transposase [Candidatus Rokubacteria bacterium]